MTLQPLRIQEIEVPRQLRFSQVTIADVRRSEIRGVKSIPDRSTLQITWSMYMYGMFINFCPRTGGKTFPNK